MHFVFLGGKLSMRCPQLIVGVIAMYELAACYCAVGRFQYQVHIMHLCMQAFISSSAVSSAVFCSRVTLSI